MESAQVRLTGVTPLLMHRFPLEPIEGLEKKTPAEQAEIAAYRDPETQELFIPGVAVQRALVAAAAFSKGKGRASLAKSVAACLFVTPTRLRLSTPVYVVDSQPVVMPATRGRVLRHRPRLDQWSVEFMIEWDETLLSAVQMRRVVDDMGSRVGLLDFRPEKKGPYGRSVVTLWNMGNGTT